MSNEKLIEELSKCLELAERRNYVPLSHGLVRQVIAALSTEATRTNAAITFDDVKEAALDARWARSPIGQWIGGNLEGFIYDSDLIALASQLTKRHVALSTESIDVERLRLVLSYADAYTAPFLRQLLRIAEGESK